MYVCSKSAQQLKITSWFVRVHGLNENAKKNIKVPAIKRKPKVRNRKRSMTAAASTQSFFASSSIVAFSRCLSALRSLTSNSLQILISRRSVLLKSVFADILSGASKRLTSLSSKRSALSRFSALSILYGITGVDLVDFMQR